MAEFDPIAFNLENADRRLLNYLPPFLQQVQEFQAVNAVNESEIKAAWHGVSRVLSNQFLAEADAQGLAVWEHELGVFARDTDTSSQCRLRIFDAWNRRPPYTLRWLQKWLDGICTPDAHSEELMDYTLTIRLNYDKLTRPCVLLKELIEGLKPMLPANMLLRLVMTAESRFDALAQSTLRPLSLQIPLRYINTTEPIIRLNGAKRLDGLWALDQEARSLRFQSISLQMALSKLPNRLSGGSTGIAVLSLPHAKQTLRPTFKAAVKLANQSGAGQPELKLTARFKEEYSLSCTLTSDTMWRLEGGELLNGAKKLNAGIKTENI